MAVSVLTNTPKISLNTSGNIFGIKFPENDGEHDQNSLMGILQVFRTLSQVDCQSVF